MGEELIKQEAEEKNKAMEIALRNQIIMEKKKQTCVAKAIREKELENQMTEKAKEITETIKTEAATAVIMKRNKLKKLINEINKKAEFKRNKLRQQLQQVRMSTAASIGNAYKKGDITKCTRAINSPKARSDYCIATFSDDFAQLNFCRQTDDFCETCCQAEFGEMNAADKDDCLKKTCKKETKPDDDDSTPKENKDSDKPVTPVTPVTPVAPVTPSSDPTNVSSQPENRAISNANGKGFIKQRGINI